MLSFKIFGIFGKKKNVFIMLIIVKLLVGDAVGQTMGEMEKITEKISAGMLNDTLSLVLKENGWHIMPKSRLFGAQKINGKEYNIEFYIAGKENNDSLKMLVKLIGKRNIRILNGYCVYNDTAKVKLYTSKHYINILKKNCSTQILNNDSLGSAIIDSIVTNQEGVIKLNK